MERQTLIAALDAAGIRPTDPRDLEAIARTAAFLRRSADRVALWLEGAPDDRAR